MKIEGMPEGWEPYAFGRLVAGEFYVRANGDVCKWAQEAVTENMYLKVRRIEPVCTWQHGVFANGWIAEDQDGEVMFYTHKPFPEPPCWELSAGLVQAFGKAWWMLNPPVFRSDLPWTERIQAVGPTIEATLKVMT